MLWIVQKDNPKPEKYIPIFIRTSKKEEQFSDTDRFVVFNSKKAALAYASQLKKNYTASTIRLFYEEGHSKNVRSPS